MLEVDLISKFQKLETKLKLNQIIIRIITQSIKIFSVLHTDLETCKISTKEIQENIVQCPEVARNNAKK